jgi:hypothetical protein
MNSDALTAFLGRAIDFLFVDDRRATSMGILFGGFVLFLSKIFAPFLARQAVLDFANVPSYLFLIVGMFLFNVPRFFRGGAALPRTAEARLKIVRAELRAKRLSREESHAMYKAVLEEELANLIAERQSASPKLRRPQGPKATTA